MTHEPKHTPKRTVTRLKPSASLEADFAGVPPVAAVERMAGLGMLAHEIALVLGIPTKVIERKFGDALKAGRALANFRVSNALFTTATDRQHRGHVAAAIYWTRARMGWSEAPPSPEGASRGSADASHLTDDEVDARFKAVMATLRGEPGRPEKGSR